MGARLRSWWQQIKQHRLTILVVISILVVVIAVIAAGYSMDWTGFNGYTIITTSKTISGVALPTFTRTIAYQPAKTLWDWMNFVFIALVTTVVAYLTSIVSNRQKKTEFEIASDKQREDALQAYIDKISELLLHENLRESAKDAEVRKIARVRTLTVLPRLDKWRKSSVLQFLYESGLIEKDKRIIRVWLHLLSRHL